MMLIHAVTKEPVPVLCKSAYLCIKDRCLLKYWNRWDKCPGYEGRKSNLELISLKLKYFKGCKSLEIKADGRNVSIYGDNAAGKTTIFDAFMWLLFGKDSLNRSDFGIKTLEDGKPMSGVDHEVEGIFMHNGQELQLKKVYHEVYTKKRGSAFEEFSGHTTDHYVNEVPVSKKAYEEKIKQIAPEDTFRLLTSPLYFNEQMKWKDRRDLLFVVCGNSIQDAEVIASDEKFKTLESILKARTIDEHKAVIAQKKKKLNEELSRIPIRIDEVTKGMPDVSGIDFAEIAEKLKSLQSQVHAEQEKLQIKKSGGRITELQKQILEIDGTIISLQNESNSKTSTELNDLNMKLVGLKGQLKAAENERDWTSKVIAQKLKDAEAKISEKKELSKKWYEVTQQTFSIDYTCPTCGQQMPENKVNEAKAKFNSMVAEQKKKINSKGLALKETIDKELKEIEDLEKAQDKSNQDIENLQLQIKQLESQVETLKSKGNDDKSQSDIKEHLDKKEALKKEIEALKQGVASEVEESEESIKIVQQLIQDLQKQIAKKDQVEADNARIKELKQQQKRLAAEFEKFESELFIVEEYIRHKARLLEENINSKFVNAKFKLFEEQINGGLEECCTVTYKGVPYQDMNNAARINTGLEIISVLIDHYGFKAPVFVDNAESVTELFQPNTQLIKLIVSEPDKQLRVAVEGDGEVATDEEFQERNK